MTNCIELSGLGKDYGGFQLEDVSFCLPGGAILGLIGANGAGKTTTIKSMLGLIRRDAGEVRLLGRSDGPDCLQEVGVVLDECFFHDTLRPRDVDLILAPVYRGWDSGLFRDYLEKFSLPPKKPIKEFSRGMKVKLSLAAAMSHRPRLLILDEATSGLDPMVREEILDEFLSFVQDEEHGILLSSHIITDLEKVADYIVYLDKGRVALQDTKDGILERYGRLACTARQLEEVEPGDLVRVRRGSYGCEALVSDRAAARKKYPHLTVEPVGLEELMIFMGRGETV